MLRNTFFILFILSAFILHSSEYKISIGNDLYGMNLFNPIDDARTVSFNTKTPLINPLTINLNYSVLTDRDLDTRIDEAIIHLNLPLKFLNNKLSVSPNIGLIISGNLGGGDIQNTLHRSIGIYTVDSSYDYSGANLAFYSSAEVIYSISIYKSEISSIKLNFEPNISTSVIPFYLFDYHIGSNLSVYGDNFKGSLQYRYGDISNLSGTPTLDKISEIESEGRISLGLSGGLFEYKLTMFPSGEFASGTFSINIGRDVAESSFSDIDLKLSPGAEMNINEPSYQRSLILAISPFSEDLSRLELLLKSSYGWRSPILKPGSFENELYKSGTHFNKFIFGANCNLFKSSSQTFLNPFIGTGIGVESYHYFREFNTDQYKTIPVYELSAGIQLLLPQFFQNDNVIYGVTMTIIRRDSLDKTAFKDKLYLNAGLTVALDL